MVYTSASENLGAIMDVCLCLKKSQIELFFSDVVPKSVIDGYINDKVAEHNFTYDEDKDLVKIRNGKEFTPQIQEFMIKAFNVLANMGSDTVLELHALDYPTMLWFVTANGKQYDVSVCPSLEVAKIAYAQRKLLCPVPEGEEDSCTHIAIVYSSQLGKKLVEKYEFDYYGILDPETGKPQYFNGNKVKKDE